MTTRVLAIACLCLFASSARAQQAAADADTVVRAILELSGQRQQLESFSVQNQERVAESRKKLKPKDFKRLEAAMKTAYDVEPLYETLFAHYRQAYDAKKAAAALEWLRSPLGRRIIEQELKILSEKDPKARQKYAQQLRAKPVPATRQALIERVQEALKSMRFARRLLSVMVRSMVTGINATLPENKRTPSSKVEELISKMVDEFDPTLQQTVRITMLYTYRDSAEEDLRAYIQFLDSDVGRWHVQVSMDSTLKAVEEAGQKVGTVLAQFVEEEGKGKKGKK